MFFRNIFQVDYSKCCLPRRELLKHPKCITLHPCNMNRKKKEKNTLKKETVKTSTPQCDFLLVEQPKIFEPEQEDFVIIVNA